MITLFQDTVERLRGRPHDERRALAASIAVGVVVVLFVGWAVFFLHGLAGGNGSQTAASSQPVQSIVASPQRQLEWSPSAATTSEQATTTTYQ